MSASPPIGRRALLLAVAAVVAVMAAMLGAPASALGAGKTPAAYSPPLPDLDARTGTVAPTPAQTGLVDGIGARAEWNRFGTPSSLVKHGDFLATGVGGADAVAAARSWLDANKGLFRLSSLESLKLDTDALLSDSPGHAVLFRQELGGLPAAQDGLLTVGLTGSAASGWKVGYVSSSVTPDTALAGPATLSATDAWLRAAADVGRGTSVVDVRSATKDGEWTVLDVAGFSLPQRARLRALPMPGGPAVPVFETIVLDGSSAAAAFKHLVDARSGAVLVREDLAEQVQAPIPFTGSVPPTDGACGTPTTFSAPSGTVSLDIVASATVPANDVVLLLKKGATTVQSADTLTSPEAIHYEPGAGVPAGTDYSVQVCDFADGTAWTPPPTNTYSGTIVINDLAGTNPFLDPRWKAFPANPPLSTLPADPWNNPSTDTRQVWCWNITGPPVAGCDREVQNLASRAPWDFNPKTSTPTFMTSGNNADSAESWYNPPTVAAGNITPLTSGYRPFSPTRSYAYPWTNAWFASDCSPANFVPTTGNDINAAITSLFVTHNRMHDWSYFLGFTEGNWNLQLSNFGTTAPSRENDPIIGSAQSGGAAGGFPLYGGRDNANMLTLPDGTPSLTNMYLWQPLAGAFYPPCVDGDYDIGVIGHEYGHAIENRMIGKGGNRSGHHAGAMGESHADLMAMEYQNEFGFVPTSNENPFAVGTYVTGNKLRAIRNYGMNFARAGAEPTPGVSPFINPLNFSDMGYDITGGQVHADGEIWSATNFDIRQALVAKYNAQYPAGNAQLQRDCAEGKRPANLCPGNRRWIQLVFDAYLLAPTAPSMVQMRDAQLAADMMRFGGANQDELWLAFARRGLGESATSTNTLSDSDTDPKPDFASPRQGEATVTFRAVASDEGGAAVNARVYVGHYEARVSPIAVTGTPATGAPGASNLDDKAAFVPGTYELVANAPGYGHVRFRRTFAAGTSATVTIKMPTNRASKAKGAVATGDGGSFDNLIDDTEATNYVRTGATPNVSGTQVTVDLQGGAQRVSRVQVSAMLAPGNNRFTALRQFEIWTCLASAVNASCTTPDAFAKRYTSPADAFPGVNPRPAAPDLILRSFSLPSAVQATHVRIVVLTNQCTGNAAFQGDQDSDPASVSDCRSGSPGAGPVDLIGDLPAQVLAPRDNEVRIAELQVFGGQGGAGGSGGGTPPPPGSCTEDDHIAMTGPLTAAPLGKVEYTLTYTNLGSEDDQECRLELRPHEDLTYVSSTGGGSYDGSTGIVSWTLGKTAPGETKTVTVTAVVEPIVTIGSVVGAEAWFGALGPESPLAAVTTLLLL